MFFHPLMWWANRKIRQEREKCCDEVAIAALRSQPKLYGTAIVGALVAEHRATPSLAVAGPARNVEERIKTIMTPNRKFHKRPTRLAALTALVLAALTVPTALTLTARAIAEKAEKAEKVDRPAPVADLPVRHKLVATFSNGATAELLAISKLHQKDQQWWAPDGSPLKAGPYGGMKDALPMYAYEMVLRFKGPANSDDRWSAGGSTSTNRGRPKDVAGKQIDDLRVYGLGFSDNANAPKRANVRYGAAMGKWKTKATFRPHEQEHHVEALAGGWEVAFSSPYEQGGTTNINVAHTLKGPANRVVAIRKDGSVGPSYGIWGRGGNALGVQTWKYGLPIADIDRFEYQTRTFEWVEFKNVSLRPGIATQVRVIEDRPGAKEEIYPGVIREYVGKKVADYPKGVNLSSPAAAAATWSRAWGSADTDAIIKTSGRKMTRQQVDKFWLKRERAYDRALLDSTVVEVLTYRKNLAAVITYLPSSQGRVRSPYSRRSFGLFDGKWKNLGEDRVRSVEAAREGFNLKKDNIWKSYQRILKDAKKSKPVTKTIVVKGPSAKAFAGRWVGKVVDRSPGGAPEASFALEIRQDKDGKLQGVAMGKFVSHQARTMEDISVDGNRLRFKLTQRINPKMRFSLVVKGDRLEGDGILIDTEERRFKIVLINEEPKRPIRKPATAPAPTGGASIKGHGADEAEVEFYYHTLDPITANLNEPRLNRYVAVTVVLAIKKDDKYAAKKMIKDRNPRLIDSLNAYFSSRTMKDVAGVKNQHRIRRDIRDLLNGELGGDKPIIDQVLFNKFNVQ